MFQLTTTWPSELAIRTSVKASSKRSLSKRRSTALESFQGFWRNSLYSLVKFLTCSRVIPSPLPLEGRTVGISPTLITVAVPTVVLVSVAAGRFSGLCEGATVGRVRAVWAYLTALTRQICRRQVWRASIAIS